MTRTRHLQWALGGMLAGIAVGWLTAPRRGSRVRSQVRQKLFHWQRAARQRWNRTRRSTVSRVRGRVAGIGEAWRGGKPSRYVDANTLVDQVRSQLGREFAATLPHINLNAAGHTLYLHGHVEDPRERDRLVEAIESIKGVRAVDARGLRLGRTGHGEIREFPRREA